MADKETVPAGRLRRLVRATARALVMIAVPVALAAAGGYYYLTGGRYVTTENAFLKARKIVVTTDVSERVVGIEVDENDLVEAGQVLFRLDEEPFRIALAGAKARLASTRHEIEALGAAYRQKLAERAIAGGDVTYFEREFERQKSLSTKGFASQSTLDLARRDVETARQHLIAFGQELSSLRAQLAGDPEAPAGRHPRVGEAQAALERAALDLRRTEVRAAVSGVVTNFELQAGEFVEAAKPVFSLVGTDTVWVQANIRETRMTHVRVGQDATLRLDAYPGQQWRAAVASISPATGTEFALLPPQNASGNWVKVVQRVPVRLELLSVPENPPLRTGMSVSVSIDTEHQRRLPRFVSRALAWVTGR